MRVVDLVCSDETEQHFWSKHRVTAREVNEVVFRYHFIIRGRGPGLYEIYGRTDAGRYLLVIVRDLGKGVANVVTSMDMNETQRRRYSRQSAH